MGHGDHNIPGVIDGVAHSTPDRSEAVALLLHWTGLSVPRLWVKSLIAFHPDARRVMLQCDAILRHHLPNDRSILEIMCRDEALSEQH